MNAWAGRLYLSLEAQARLGVTDPYSIHRLLLDLIDAERPTGQGTPSGLQWVDKGQTIYGRRIDFLTVHPVPNVNIAEDVTLQVKPLSADFLNHSQYRFQVTLNPTISKSVSIHDERGKRVPVVGEEAVAEWVLKRMGARGMDVSITSIDKQGKDVFYKKNTRFTFVRARVSGILTVTDSDLFRKAFFTGVGSGRAFGYGFLQIARM